MNNYTYSGVTKVKVRCDVLTENYKLRVINSDVSTLGKENKKSF